MKEGVAVSGFYTEEIRDGSGRGKGSQRSGPRVGFDVVDIKGRRGQLARIGGRLAKRTFHKVHTLINVTCTCVPYSLTSSSRRTGCLTCVNLLCQDYQITLIALILYCVCLLYLMCTPCTVCSDNSLLDSTASLM